MLNIDHVENILNMSHPEIKTYDPVLWRDLPAVTAGKVLILFGSARSCELFVQRLSALGIRPDYVMLEDDGKEHICGIPVIAGSSLNSIGNDYILLITYEDYPGILEVYNRVSQKLISIHANNIITVHEFSAGFALGAERMRQEKSAILAALEALNDEKSRRCFISFISRLCTPYHWNMDIREENFGIPNPSKAAEADEWTYESEFDVVNDGLCVFCNSCEWDAHDPKLELAQRNNSLMFYPQALSRLKLREFLALTGRTPEVVDLLLWEYQGEVIYEAAAFSGGTPLSYPTRVEKYQSIRVDDLVDLYPNTKVSLLSLTMEENCVSALLGAQEVLKRDNPVVAINGFKRGESLWRVIRRLHTAYPEHDLYLRRFATENPLAGHVIYLIKEK